MPVPHPDDLNEDFRIEMNEAILSLMAWQQGQNTLANAIRAAFIWQNGECYTYNSSITPPLCWELAPCT